MDHVRPYRLVEVADKNARFTEAEFHHIEKCSECVDALAKVILKEARQRAQQKTIGKKKER